MSIKPLEPIEAEETVTTAQKKTKPAASSEPRIKRKIDSAVEGKRKQKIYTLLQKNGVWFKLNQNNVTVYDAETDQVRSIRYCPNEPSVYADKQAKESIREHIIFRDSLLAVEANRSNLQDYLDMHPGNTKNGGNLFQEVNTEVKADTELANEFLLHDAVGLVRDKSIDELLPVAMYLGINIEQKNSEIKRELLLTAKANPKAFIEMFDNPVVRVRSIVKQAIDYNILKTSTDAVMWADNSRMIVALPMGQDPEDVMSRFLLQDKGAAVYDDLVSRLAKIA
jgi:hypothetical protein